MDSSSFPGVFGSKGGLVDILQCNCTVVQEFNRDRTASQCLSCSVLLARNCLQRPFYTYVTKTNQGVVTMVMHRLASGMRDSVLHEVSEERNLRVVTTKTNHSIVTWDHLITCMKLPNKICTMTCSIP